MHPLLQRAFALALFALFCFPPVALAGGGPENLLLVVNANSESSKTIANHYIQLREIPRSNVLHLDWEGDVEGIGVAQFREKLLGPAIEAIRERGLEKQIDYLVYSSDFPWKVGLKDEGSPVNPTGHAATASTTGLTYLWRPTMAKEPAILSLASNNYCQPPAADSSYGFRGWYGWGPGGKRMETGGESYLISTMLGVTSGRGNTTEEVIGYLRRAESADGTRPDGTVYYMKNGDVRSRTRDGLFDAAVANLEELGVHAEVLEGTLPDHKKDVVGAMVGKAGFSWPKSGSTILPGAICEHLTSFGGILSKGAGQTPLTEFLRYGAAGASGTVVEPYAIQAKFPLASIHVHYARGCTLGEAFYQSVAGPYQLLIVGDPLCRPWASIPTVETADVRANQTLRGEIEIEPLAGSPDGQEIARFELFLDGIRRGHCQPGEKLELDTSAFGDGMHELRIVAIAAGPIETQGRLVLPVLFDNHGQSTMLVVSPQRNVSASSTLNVTVQSPGASEIYILQNLRPVARVPGARGSIKLDAATLGKGPVALQAVGMSDRQTFSDVVRIEIE